MVTENEVQGSALAPLVEIYVTNRRISAAAGGDSESRLSAEQIAALQQTVTSLVGGFRPPEVRKDDTGIQFESLEVEFGFKIETGAGSVLKLLFDASAGASIKAKVVWSRPK